LDEQLKKENIEKDKYVNEEKEDNEE